MYLIKYWIMKYIVLIMKVNILLIMSVNILIL